MARGSDEVAAEELAAIPGMNEGSVLLWLEQAYRDGDYDLIVVDSAPTGETLTLLTLPEATQWWVSRALPFQQAAIKTFGFAVRKTTGIPLDKGYEELNRLFDKLKEIHAVLSDASVSTVRLVANPEKMVLEETRRAYTYLQLYGYGVDAVLVNRILPADGVGTALEKYVAAQARYLDEIEASFAPATNPPRAAPRRRGLRPAAAARNRHTPLRRPQPHRGLLQRTHLQSQRRRRHLFAGDPPATGRRDRLHGRAVWRSTGDPATKPAKKLSFA